MKHDRFRKDDYSDDKNIGYLYCILEGKNARAMARTLGDIFR